MADTFLQSPYPARDGCVWLKGNLHTHTTRSDGTLDVQDIVRRYAALGHDFLAVSDHDQPADYSGIDPAGLLLLAGSEVTSGGPHVLNVGAEVGLATGPRQQAIDAIGAAGGLAVLCHPNWEQSFNHFPFAQLLALRNYRGIEIFNGGTHWGTGGGIAISKWDMLLSRGRPAWGFANDDAHHANEIGRGWNVVCVRERTAEAVLEALAVGAFYASTGVTIESITCDGAKLEVFAPDAEAIAIAGEHGKRLALVESDRLAFDAGDIATAYVRVECFGRGERQAWSQPIMLAGPETDRLRVLLADRPVLRAFRADRLVRLTGRLDDPLWASAMPTDTFYRLPRADRPAVATEVRAIAAAQTLYLAVRCEEPRLADMRMAASPDRGNIFSDDSIEIYFDLTGRGESYHYIQANAAGLAILSNRATGRLKTSMKVLSGRYEAGWTLEVAIPLDELGGLPSGARSFGFNIHRNRSIDQSSVSWSFGGATYHAPEHFGLLEI